MVLGVRVPLVLDERSGVIRRSEQVIETPNGTATSTRQLELCALIHSALCGRGVEQLETFLHNKIL
eukprot:2737377-Amphidinium_carterae.1